MEKMGIENILKEEMLNVNRGIIKKRKSLKNLLSDPRIDDVKLDEKCLRKIAERCTLPLDEILLPITFFLSAGLDEGYLQVENDARVVESLDIRVVARNGLFWVKKYDIRKLVTKYPGCFQMIILP